MAINYYANIGMIGSDIEMNKNELKLPVIDNLSTQPAAAASVEGQMYFDTTAGDKTMYFFNGTAWVEMDGSGSGVEKISATNGTFVEFNSGTNLVDAQGDVDFGTFDLAATGTPSGTNFLRGDNVWATPAGSYTSWSLEGNNATTVDITDGLRVDFTGGEGINTTVAAATPNTLTIDLDINKLTTAGVSTTDFIAFSDESETGDPTRKVSVANLVALAPQGDVKSVAASSTNAELGIKTTNDDGPDVTVGLDIEGLTDLTSPANADDFLIYDASTTTNKKIGFDTLKTAFGGNQSITLSGDVSGTGSTAITTTIGADKVLGSMLNDNVISSQTALSATPAVADELLISDGGTIKKITVANLVAAAPQGDITGIDAGTYISIGDPGTSTPTVNALGTEAATADRLVARDENGIGKVATPGSGSSDESIATTAFVNAKLTGLLEFKGGFNASTGAIVGGGNLTSGGTRVAVEIGDYYVVTADGDFFGNAATPLTTGDSVIVQTAAVAGASVEGDFVIVQSDTDLATGTTVGIGNVEGTAGQIGVTYSAGTGTITNLDRGSSQLIFKTITAPTGGNIVADSNSDTLNITASGGMTITNTPGTDTINFSSANDNTEYTAGTGLTLSGTEFSANVDGTNSVAANTSSTTAGRTYRVQVNSSDDLVVNVPWADTNTNLVTSVDEKASGTSNGTPIVVDPTTGAVKIQSMAYDGGANVGHVPTGGSSTTFLRGDGTFATPINTSGVTSITASTDIAELGVVITDGSTATPEVGFSIKSLSAMNAVAGDDKLLIADASDSERQLSVTVAKLTEQHQTATTYAQTLGAFTTGTTIAANAVVHNLNSFDVMVQLYDETTKETIQAKVDRTSVDIVSVTGNSYPSGNITVLVSKIG